MSQICSQSNTHLNPAHASPAADEPTRNRTSEESGMQKDQHTTHSMTALLREESSVDTLETNSLCCAAAGIIAPANSTTEALIPHEKLREAATPNATLIAQNRPPAQPAVGYKSLMQSSDRTLPLPLPEDTRYDVRIWLQLVSIALGASIREVEQ